MPQATAPAAAPPGWYPAPDGTTAWWDGRAWHRQQPGQQPGAFGPAGPAAGQGAPPEPYRSVASLAVVVQVALGAMALLGAFMAFADVRRWQVVGKLVDGEFVSLAELDDADGLAITATVLLLGGVLVTGIVFLVWVHRIQRNLRRALGVHGMAHTPGWSVGWWFVPFANLIKPKAVLNEAWLGSSPDEPVGSIHWARRPVPPLLSWWWGTWILSGLVTQFSMRVGRGPDDGPEAFQMAMVWSVVGSTLTVIAALLAIAVVRSVTARHIARATRLGVATA